MSDYFIINSLSLASLLVAVSIPLYLSFRVHNKQVRNLAIVLTVFVSIHSLYHVSYLVGYEELGASFFNPLSVIILIIFGAYMLNLSRIRLRATQSGGKNQ